MCVCACDEVEQLEIQQLALWLQWRNISLEASIPNLAEHSMKGARNLVKDPGKETRNLITNCWEVQEECDKRVKSNVSVSMYLPVKTLHKIYFNQCHFPSGSLQLALTWRMVRSFVLCPGALAGEAFPLKLQREVEGVPFLQLGCERHG